MKKIKTLLSKGKKTVLCLIALLFFGMSNSLFAQVSYSVTNAKASISFETITGED